MPAAHEHPALPPAVQGGPGRGRVPLGDPRQPAAGLDGARLPAPLRQPLPSRRGGRAREHARRAPPDRRRGAALRRVRADGQQGAGAKARADRARGRDRRCRSHRPDVRLLPRPPRPQRHRLRSAPRRRRHAPLRPAGVPPAEGGARQGDRADRAPRREVPVQREGRPGPGAQRCRTPVRRRLPRDRDLERGMGLPARDRARRRDPGPAVPGGGLARRAGPDRPECRGDRRGQRRHRLRAHGPPPRRRGDDRLPPRAEGHAGHPGGDRGGRARGRQGRLSRRPAPDRGRQGRPGPGDRGGPDEAGRVRHVGPPHDRC